ncbi:MAG: gliding motility-associated C-terminal domain-containing protein [bacterium]|nr:gliding motility-associated C-terminal domain-containing protein [bacterium]
MRKLLAFLFICASFYSKSQAICAGSSATLSAPNPSNLGQPSYTLLPGGSSNNTGIFVVSPLTTTTYTFLTRGTSGSSVITTSSVTILTVNPQPKVVPTVTSANCTSTVSGFNLNLTFTPLSPVPGYTVLWGPPLPPPNIPIGILSPQQTSVATGVSPGSYEATITAVGGCQVLVNFTINPAPAPATFSLMPYGSVYTLTCVQPTIDVTASNIANTYTWSNTSSLPIISQSVNLNVGNLGTWSVTGQNTTSGCVKTLTFQLVQNVNTPTSTISQSLIAITCGSAIPTISMTATPSVNITHYIFDPLGGIFIANSYTAIYTPGGPGTYTYDLMDNVSGCKSTKHFTITSTSGFPTYNVTSPDSFTLGCTTKSVATININGAATFPTPGGAISYTLIGPPTSTTIPTGTNVLSPFSTYTINIPGTWTVIVKDNSNLCETRTPISILQNTFAPAIAASASLDLYVLDCTNTVTILQGFSETPNISYNWSFQGTPSNFPGSTVTVIVNKIAPTTTIINTYTLTITDLSSTCKSTTVITMRQNLFVPKVGFALGVPGITCQTPTVVLTNTSTSGIPANTYPVIYPVIGYIWSGPSPQPTVQVSTTYVASIVGTYTLVGKDLNNGCFGVATGSVDDLRDYPVVNNPTAPVASVLDCGATSTKVYPAITSPTNSLAYLWKAPNIASVSCNTCFSLTTNFPGTYTITVTNTLNFCATSSTMSVKNGSLTGAFEVDHDKGYAPLSVSFINNSFSSNSKDNINSNWGFGNGTTSVSVQASVSPVVVYSQPGTYSVVLYVNKGACFDTATKFITVEVPSKLEIPNMFTPNGDGINDLYFLKTSNLTEINFRIIDRWGHLVYELTSSTGNVLWDGKNQTGAEVAEGVYYFTLSATGKDGVSYNEKGQITLLR